MACFRLPKGQCQELSKLVAKFWWSNGLNDSKIHWLSRNTMTTSKDHGGLGLKEFYAFNTALLCKQVWRLLTKPNLLMSKVLKSRYFPKSDLFQVKTKARDSWL